MLAMTNGIGECSLVNVRNNTGSSLVAYALRYANGCQLKRDQVMTSRNVKNQNRVTEPCCI